MSPMRLGVSGRDRKRASVEAQSGLPDAASPAGDRRSVTPRPAVPTIGDLGAPDSAIPRRMDVRRKARRGGPPCDGRLLVV